MPNKSTENHFDHISWTESGALTHYAIRLPMQSFEVPFDFFNDKDRVFGQFAFVNRINESTYEAIRDPLGINKLFYTETNDGELVFSEQYTRLFRYKTKIYAIPSGKHVRLKSGGERTIVKEIGLNEEPMLDLSIDSLERQGFDERWHVFQNAIKIRIKHVFELIRRLENKGWKIFIALSGGLDSSGIAYASVKYLKAPIACTLNLGQSEDAEKAALIADRIGIQHLSFNVDRNDILNAVHDSPYLCQDFRDFNVHCAALNLLLARNTRNWVNANMHQDNKIIILTGDLMNEYLCDYADEIINGQAYYKLPRIGKKGIQRYLIRGIDTSDRELLPFATHGLNCLQPYSALFDLYSGIEEDILEIPDVKKRLNSFLVPQEISDFIPKNKLRAQVGNHENKGILGICHQEQIMDRHFKSMLLEKADGDQGQIPIFVGKYDVEEFSGE